MPKVSQCVKDIEFQLIQELLIKHSGNLSRIAQEMGVSYKTVINKIYSQYNFLPAYVKHLRREKDEEFTSRFQKGS